MACELTYHLVFEFHYFPSFLIYFVRVVRAWHAERREARIDICLICKLMFNQSRAGATPCGRQRRLADRAHIAPDQQRAHARPTGGSENIKMM